MVRKSKMIWNIYNNFKVLDSIHINQDTRLIVKCLNCGKEQEKNRKSILNSKCECDYCGNGRKYHNSNGFYGTKIYTRYVIMLNRVNHKKQYKNVDVCDEWKSDFMTFYNWSMENGYRDDLTIDRIDNSKGYSPDNCRWVDLKTQANNRTNNVVIEDNGEKMTLSQLAEKYNIPKYIVYNRYKAKWSIEDIINKPIDVTKRSKNYGK